MSEETIDDLMEATYRALCKHGYAELTMQDIAAESTKSKGTLHYHFERKQDLLEAFLEYLLDRFEERTATVPGETPAEQLHEFFEELLTPSDEDSAEAFRTAVLEIKAQSPYSETYRERLAEFDRALHDRIADFVAEGRETGQFRDDVDPAATADFLVTVFHGAQTRAAAVDHSPERTKRYVHAYIDDVLLDEDADDAAWTGSAAAADAADAGAADADTDDTNEAPASEEGRE